MGEHFSYFPPHSYFNFRSLCPSFIFFDIGDCGHVTGYQIRVGLYGFVVRFVRDLIDFLKGLVKIIINEVDVRQNFALQSWL